MPKTFLDLNGDGDTITDNYEWGACEKAVFVWESTGSGNIVAYLHKPGAERGALIVNGVSPDSGETLQPLSGGTYYVEVSARSSAWAITGECRD